MLKKLLFGTAAIAATFTALPAAAEAHGRYRGYGHYYPTYHYGYAYAPRRYYPRSYHSYGYHPRRYGYHARSYYGPRYYRGDRYYRCGSGTTGAIIGGAAGALLGREIGRGGRYGYYGYRRGSGTTGAIIGGAAGALIGREIGRSC